MSSTSVFPVSWEKQYDEIGHSCGKLVTGSFVMTMCPLFHPVSCRVYWQNIKSPRWLRLPIAQIWHSVSSGFSQNWNHLWKEKDLRLSMRFRKIQQDSWWRFKQSILQSVLNSRRDAGRTVWGPKMPALKGTESSLSYVQCFLYLVSSSIMSLFFILHGWILFGQTSYIFQG